MKNKQIRRIIVLIMCLVLLFNVVTSAYAAGVGTIFFGSMAAAAVVASAYQCLGVLKGMDDTDFVNLVNSGVSHLESTTDLVSEGYIRMLGVKYGDTDQFVSYAQNTMIQALAQFIASPGSLNDSQSIVSPSESVTSFLPTGFGSFYFSDPVFITGFYTQYSNGTINWKIYAVSNSAFSYGNYPDSLRYYSDLNGSVYYASLTSMSGSTRLPSFPVAWNFVTNDAYGAAKPSSVPDGYVSNSDGVILGDYESPYIDGAPVGFGSLAVYMPWASQGVSVPLPGTTTDEDWVPVSIGGSTLDDTVLGQTQAGAQAGTAVDGLTWEEVGSESIPDTEVGTATLADILSAVLSIPQAIVGSIAQALSNFFGISGTADAYAISLTDFFPFCIPFDIYDFLSVLSAEPEAPVFHWEIPVPQLGRTFDIDVDLSPWDPVAAVFRTFELLAFIVGLGMVTREKFLRS